VVAERHIVAVNADILTRFAVNDVCIGNGCLSTSEKMVDLGRYDNIPAQTRIQIYRTSHGVPV
jgi:hypothetical protein